MGSHFVGEKPVYTVLTFKRFHWLCGQLGDFFVARVTGAIGDARRTSPVACNTHVVMVYGRWDFHKKAQTNISINDTRFSEAPDDCHSSWARLARWEKDGP